MVKTGPDEETRTPTLFLDREALWPLSYAGTSGVGDRTRTCSAEARCLRPLCIPNSTTPTFGAPREIRTLTARGLNPPPLPLGYGSWWGREELNLHLFLRLKEVPLPIGLRPLYWCARGLFCLVVSTGFEPALYRPSTYCLCRVGLRDLFLFPHVGVCQWQL